MQTLLQFYLDKLVHLQQNRNIWVQLRKLDLFRHSFMITGLVGWFLLLANDLPKNFEVSILFLVSWSKIFLF